MANVLKNYCKAYEILPPNTPALLDFKMDGILSYFEGKEYTVTLACSNRSVSLSAKKFIVQNGQKFNTSIQSTTAGHALVEIRVDGVVNLRISFKFIDSKDVFKKSEYDLMTDELKYVASQLKGGDRNGLDPPPPLRNEYRRRSYCMGGAERGLSKLLDDITNFYAVERGAPDDHKNNISFTGEWETAKGRGKHFARLGLTGPVFNFNDYEIIESKKNLIFNAKTQTEAESNYGNVEDSIIELKNSAKANLSKKFEEDLKGKEPGYHVYYITVTDGFHTLLLVIDKTTDPCKPTYEIWDQNGLTRSHGLLSDIELGMRRQTCWTFALSCLKRYEKKNTKAVDSTNTYLWKMKRRK